MCWEGTELARGSTGRTIIRGTSEEGYILVQGSMLHVLHVFSSVPSSAHFVEVETTFGEVSRVAN